jgi:Putative zinc- or iron-chelating domain
MPEDAARPDPEVVRGLVYAHNRANANTAEVHAANSTVRALVDLLVERGVLDPDALEARRQDAADRLQRHYRERGMGVAVQEFEGGKYHFPGGAVIDCDNRIPLCGAACCKLPFALSREDIREGVVRWDLGRPYMIAQDPDHTCVHLDRRTRRCGVYEQRPVPCRGYDCRNDTRIWLDFDNRVVNPRINDPDWPACLQEDDPDAP